MIERKGERREEKRQNRSRKDPAMGPHYLNRCGGYMYRYQMKQ
jgi:hypothetical protein